MKTERIVTLVSTEQAKALNARAKAMKISTGEYVRQAIESYEPDADHEELAALAKELHEVVKRAKASMKRLRDDGKKRTKPATKKAKELAHVD
jgi:hypothetical protein